MDSVQFRFTKAIFDLIRSDIAFVNLNRVHSLFVKLFVTCFALQNQAPGTQPCLLMGTVLYKPVYRRGHYFVE